ncbi:DUF2948 family protein [Marinibaculum pumilum]|uniref:DUF2948 family protein n=1 Tax=Marinibaculum pumilum TaxID=1766165 RepID=A0ABV7L3J4_9PROT
MAARLQAQDLEDLAVISALLQDAAVRVGDIAWLPKRRRFAFGGSRFQWEQAAAPDGGKPARIGFGAHVDSVLSVASRGIAQDRPDDILVLLAVTADFPAGTADEGGPDDEGTGPAGEGAISLIFAGGSAITLRVECIDMSLADLGAPYATRLTPDHDLDKG